MIYIAQPYTHSNAITVNHRVEQVELYFLQLMQRKRWAYSPIMHCHALTQAHNVPASYTTWSEYNLHMIERSSAVHALLLEGWQFSKGLHGELTYAKLAGKPVYLIPYNPADCKFKETTIQHLLTHFTI